eukprot:918630-Prymnesium_polylepis.1
MSERLSAHACPPCSHSSRRSVPFKGSRHGARDFSRAVRRRADGIDCSDGCGETAPGEQFDITGLDRQVGVCASAAQGCGDGGTGPKVPSSPVLLEQIAWRKVHATRRVLC